MSRQPSNLSESLHRQLNAYALAASAAAVGVLALVQPAEAKIIYYRAHRLLRCGPTPLDLNHDGVADFYFVQNCTGIVSYLSIHPPSGRTTRRNLIWGYGDSASALKAGVKIHASKKLKGGKHNIIDCAAGTGCTGPWYGVTAYLGLKFDVKGKTHYAWARVYSPDSQNLRTLTGYAYEIIPNKPIITGKTKGPDVIARQDGSLRQLARGASAIPAWRRK